MRKAEEKMVFFVCLAAALLATCMLFWIIGSIFLGGLESLTWYFLSTPESETPRIGMGILNAIVGTIILSAFATFLATPFAFFTAIYLTRYARETWYVKSLRFFIEVLSGTPSIVLGMFGFLVFVYYLKFFTGGFSLLSGSIALAILIMPVIERATEDAINTVENHLEEGSYALGATKWQTVRGITIPGALSGIITGTILGFGRAAEESAVVILTAGYTQYMPSIAMKPNPDLLCGVKIYPFQHVIASLPYSVYHAYENSNIIPLSNGFTAAFVLICVVLVINILAKTIFWYSTRTSRNPSPLLSSLTRTLFGGNGRFSRIKPIPAPACAAAEIADAKRDASIPIPQKIAIPARITSSPFPTTAEPDGKETLSSGLQVHHVREEGGAGTPGGGMAASDVASTGNNPYDSLPDPPGAPLPIDDLLFEDGSALPPDAPGKDPETAQVDPESAFTPDYPLLEEDPDPRVIEVPADEPWRRMTRNRLENTIAGITADPWEGP